MAKATKSAKKYVYYVRWMENKNPKKESISRQEVLKRTMPQKTSKAALAWKKENPWFGVDEAKTAAALGLHERLLKRGVKADSQQYWDKVNAWSKDYDSIGWTELPSDHVASTDLVNHPPHYKAGGIETIDFIEAKDLNFRLGNVIKYVARAEKKGNPLEDLKKAKWYLEREIAVRERA